jgi:hypothetical protein
MAHDLDPAPWEATAESQAGVISMRSALRAGLSHAQIRAHLESGRWRRPMQDVFVTRPGALTRRQLLWCAVESLGVDAVLGGASAAEVDGLRGYEQEQITVLVASDRRLSPRPGVTIRRTARLDPADVRAGGHPRRTCPARSVIDMAEWAPENRAAQAVLAAAVQQRIASVDELRATLRGRGPIIRRTLVGETLDEMDAAAGAVAELMYRRVERAFGLPEGRRQHLLLVGDHLPRLDVLYEPWGVRVVVDAGISRPNSGDVPGHRRNGSATPSSPASAASAASAEADAPVCRTRTAVHYDIDDLRDRPERVGAQVGQLLRGHGWPGRPEDLMKQAAMTPP